jgi:hypothetical protein
MTNVVFVACPLSLSDVCPELARHVP